MVRAGNRPGNPHPSSGAEQVSNYTDAVTAGLEGLQAVSTGVCPGCSTCAHEHDYSDDNEDPTRTLAAFDYDD